MSKLLYYKMMTPKWLEKSKDSNFDCAHKPNFQDLRVVIPPDTSPYERIATITLLPGSAFAQFNDPDITVQIVIGLEIDGTNEVIDGRTKVMDMPKEPTDPIAFMLSDGRHAMGMVIQDIKEDHAIPGPYYAIQADIGPTALYNVNTNVGQMLTRTSESKNNPDQFCLTIKPNAYWGCAYSAMDGGHKTLAYYNQFFDVKNGLYLQICRVSPKGTFKINYIEVTIYGENKPN